MRRQAEGTLKSGTSGTGPTSVPFPTGETVSGTECKCGFRPLHLEVYRGYERRRS